MSWRTEAVNSGTYPETCGRCGSSWTRRTRRWLSATAVLLAFNAAGQGIPPEEIDRFSQVIGARIEAVVILGGDYTANAGAYRFRGENDATLEVLKLGGAGRVRAPRPLGSTSVRWSPTLAGTAGLTSASNPFADGPLAGNALDFSVAAAEAGAGARFQINDSLSLMPLLCFIYGHVENEFRANTPAGEAVEAAAEAAGLVNWDTTTWTMNPSLELRYTWRHGRIAWEYISRFIYFHTEDLESSSPLVNVDGRSSTWFNKLDVDVPLGWTLWGHELHTGGYVSRNDLFGDLRGALDSSHIYTVSGRVVLADVGQIFRYKVRWAGLAATRFWGRNFDGWSFGVTLRWSI